jgi:hypothetical protein
VTPKAPPDADVLARRKTRSSGVRPAALAGSPEGDLLVAAVSAGVPGAEVAGARHAGEPTRSLTDGRFRRLSRGGWV